jgi:hypothetical protein
MIKVIKEVKESETIKPFPKLMINEDNEIVYFVRHGYGLPITGKGWDYLRIEANLWDMNYFTDYNDPLTIQNM